MIRLATFQWKVFGIVLCFLLTLPLVILRADALSFRIINGTDAVQGEYPFMVAISVKGVGTKFHHTCGGSYIHVHWVLTAAHCLKPRWLITKYYLNIGSVDFDAGKFYRRKGVKRIIHNEYADRPIPRNDIGLIKINQPFGDRSHRTGIPKHFAYTVNTTVIALGFGATQLFDNKECAVDPKKLQKLTTRIKERMFNIDSNTFFIGQYNNNVCFGDSGGPVLHNKTLIGVISSIGYSKSPNCEATYARVVKVVKYYDWIQLSINSTSYLASHYTMLPYTILFWYHYYFFLIL